MTEPQLMMSPGLDSRIHAHLLNMQRQLLAGFLGWLACRQPAHVASAWIRG